MRWTRQRFARDGIAARVERLVSDQQRADERCCCVRRSRVVLTPRRWRQVGGIISADDGDNKARSPGRARRKPLKPLRAGTPGDSGVLVYSCAVLLLKRTRACGCHGHPAFPTPSLGGRAKQHLGRFASRGRKRAFEIGDFRRVGKAQRAHLSRMTMWMVGTAQARLCPPYENFH